ncbi:MAG: iron uptake system protein EfeO [Tuberibacillus sp.]
MPKSKKLLTFLCSLLVVLALAACGADSGKKSDAKNVSEKTPASIKDGAESMLRTLSDIENALKDKDVTSVQKNGKSLNDQWLSFETDVREKFPLLYTKIEKFEQPIFAESSVDTPNLDHINEQVDGLKAALNELKSAKATTQKTSVILNQAVKEYKNYVQEQADQLVDSTTAFVDAVKAQNAEKARQLYPEARVYYERIEPIAESFGDLDPKIDARINDVDDPAKWTGFHRIEKALWKDQNLDGMDVVADQLLSDVQELKKKISQIQVQPEQVVAGSMELLNEAAISKITGEEENYSHIDLVDLSANVEGSEAVYHAIIPALENKNKDLAQKLDEQFMKMKDSLNKYKRNGQYVNYTTLTKEQIRELSNELTQLSQLMAQTAEIL